MAESKDPEEQKEQANAEQKETQGRCKVCGKQIPEGSDVRADSFNFCSRKCLQNHLMRGERSRHRGWRRS